MSSKSLLLAVAVAAGLNGAVRADEEITPPAVPSDIAAPAGFKPFLRGHAVGTQNYVCAPAPTASGFDWLFVGPQATIFDSEMEQILTHYQSRNPLQNDVLHAAWLHSRDSSAVWAKKFTGSTDAGYVSPGAIEWLLLEVTGTQLGPTAGDRLANTAFIQRVNTEGGVKPPAADCTAATVNTRKLVRYEADYYFYR
jgi:hypothetical protein